MGRYGLILGPIEAYTQNIAIGTIVDPISAHIKSKNTKIYKYYTKIQKYTIYIYIYIYIPVWGLVLGSYI